MGELKMPGPIETWLSDPNHWCKGAYVNDRGQTCLVGAIRKFHMNDKDFEPVHNKIRAAIFNLFPEAPFSTSMFNDQKGYDAVMKVVREAGV